MVTTRRKIYTSSAKYTLVKLFTIHMLGLPGISSTYVIPHFDINSKAPIRKGNVLR